VPGTLARTSNRMAKDQWLDFSPQEPIAEVKRLAQAGGELGKDDADRARPQRVGVSVCCSRTDVGRRLRFARL